MLKLKEALKDCGIRQQEVVKATGFGKTQISLTLSTGKLPAGEEKFKAGVIELVAKTKLGEWLEKRGMSVEQLFEIVTDAEDQAGAGSTAGELDTALINYAGRVALGQTLNAEETLSLIRVSRYLLFKAGDEIGDQVKSLLTGG